MKNILGIFIFIAVMGMMALVSCEPIENRQVMKGAVTEADVRKYVKIDVIQRESEITPGKMVNSNFINITSDGLAPCVTSFTYGLGTYVGTNISNLQAFVVAGEQTVFVNVLNADGTRLDPIPFPLTVDEAFDVAPEWAIFCGDGEKDWIWDTSVGAPYGMGDALNSNSADWWGHWNDDGIHNGLEGADASMTFSATGATLIKNLSDGTTVRGTFSFDMTKVIPSGYARSVGTLTTSIPVLNGQTTGADTGNGVSGKDVLVYQMIQLDDNHLYLSWPEASFDPSAGWGQATLWFFKSAQ